MWRHHSHVFYQICILFVPFTLCCIQKWGSHRLPRVLLLQWQLVRLDALHLTNNCVPHIHVLWTVTETQIVL